jgi:hypothetical protein
VLPHREVSKFTSREKPSRRNAAIASSRDISTRLGIITVRDSPEEPPPELEPCEPKADQLADPAHPDATNATHINALMAATLNTITLVDRQG